LTIHFIKYEDLASNPIEEFRKLYNFLDIEFNNDIENKIFSYTNANNKTNISKKNYMEIKRNSKFFVDIFKKRLTKDQIYKIRKETKEIWIEFYNEKDW